MRRYLATVARSTQYAFLKKSVHTRVTVFSAICRIRQDPSREYIQQTTTTLARRQTMAAACTLLKYVAATCL